MPEALGTGRRCLELTKLQKLPNLVDLVMQSHIPGGTADYIIISAPWQINLQHAEAKASPVLSARVWGLF